MTSSRWHAATVIDTPNTPPCISSIQATRFARGNPMSFTPRNMPPLVRPDSARLYFRSRSCRGAHSEPLFFRGCHSTHRWRLACCRGWRRTGFRLGRLVAGTVCCDIQIARGFVGRGAESAQAAFRGGYASRVSRPASRRTKVRKPRDPFTHCAGRVPADERPLHARKFRFQADALFGVGGQSIREKRPNIRED